MSTIPSWITSVPITASLLQKDNPTKFDLKRIPHTCAWLLSFDGNIHSSIRNEMVEDVRWCMRSGMCAGDYGVKYQRRVIFEFLKSHFGVGSLVNFEQVYRESFKTAAVVEEEKKLSDIIVTYLFPTPRMIKACFKKAEENKFDIKNSDEGAADNELITSISYGRSRDIILVEHNGKIYWFDSIHVYKLFELYGETITQKIASDPIRCTKESIDRTMFLPISTISCEYKLLCYSLDAVAGNIYDN